jgi:hypothetical protein
MEVSTRVHGRDLIEFETVEMAPTQRRRSIALRSLRCDAKPPLTTKRDVTSVSDAFFRALNDTSLAMGLGSKSWSS